VLLQTGAGQYERKTFADAKNGDMFRNWRSVPDHLSLTCECLDLVWAWDNCAGTGGP
jgi:hypothetical protein